MLDGGAAGGLFCAQALGLLCDPGPMNPYAAAMGDDEPLATIKETPRLLQVALAGASEGWIDQPWAEGKWTRRQVLAHIADTEIAFAFRLRQTMAEDAHVIQPFDQDAWAGKYATVNAASALAMFTALRQWNVEFFESLEPEDFSKRVTHPERGTMTLRTILETMAGHDNNHLGQFAG